MMVVVMMVVVVVRIMVVIIRIMHNADGNATGDDLIHLENKKNNKI